eukprot:4600860-Alexandrium_andersonii.AAC.1
MWRDCSSTSIRAFAAYICVACTAHTRPCPGSTHRVQRPTYNTFLGSHGNTAGLCSKGKQPPKAVLGRFELFSLRFLSGGATAPADTPKKCLRRAPEALFG